MAQQHIIGGVIVKERHPFAPLGLSILTLGIYYFVWWYKINDEMRRLGENNSPGLAVLAFIPGGILIIPPFVTLWTTSERISRLQDRARCARPVSPGMALLMTFLPIVNFFVPSYLQSGLNRAYQMMATHGQAPGGYAQAPGYPNPPYAPYPQQQYPQPQYPQQQYPQQPQQQYPQYPPPPPPQP